MAGTHLLNMKPRSRSSLLILALGAFFAAPSLLAFPLPQAPKVQDIDNLDAIGNRKIGFGVNLYSLEREKTLGKTMADEVERRSKTLDDEVATEYVNRLARELAANSDSRFPITLKIVDSEIANGFTLPGGFLYINKGLIVESDTEAELASALAYGIARIALRSETRAATRGEFMGLASVPAMILSPHSLVGSTGALYQATSLAIPLAFLKQERDSVLIADYLALEYLYKTGYEPEYYSRLVERTRPTKAQIAFSAFPSAAVRLQAMCAEIAKILPRRNGALVTSPEFLAIKDRLKTKHAENQSLRPDLRRVAGP